MGWSNKYDAWVSIYSPLIQRLNTVSRFYKVAGKNTMLYETLGTDDAND